MTVLAVSLRIRVILTAWDVIMNQVVRQMAHYHFSSLAVSSTVLNTGLTNLKRLDLHGKGA